MLPRGIRNYYHTYRLFTIRAIVTKWAPPNENNTRAYVENVSRLTGIDPGAYTKGTVPFV